MERSQISKAALLTCQHYQELHDIFEGDINRASGTHGSEQSALVSTRCKSGHHSSLPPVKNTHGKNEQQITSTTAQKTIFSENYVSRNKKRKRALMPGFVTSKQDTDTSVKMSPEALHISCHLHPNTGRITVLE